MTTDTKKLRELCLHAISNRQADSHDQYAFRNACPPDVVVALLDENNELRSALLTVREVLGSWSDLNKAHEYGCGNGRDCDACHLDDVITAALAERA